VQLTESAGSISKSQKKKNNKKKSAANKAQEAEKVNGTHAASQAEEHDDEVKDGDEHAVWIPCRTCYWHK
jgi:hypothetical protein